MDRAHESRHDGDLWRAVVKSEMRFFTARAAFMTGATDRVAMIREALHQPSERGAALRVLRLLTVAERQQAFDDLVDLASVGHRDVGLCRDVILSLPHDWVTANIERSAERLLREGSDEEYRRLLELYFELDAQLARRLASRAAHSDDADIREAGEDFLERLNAR